MLNRRQIPVYVFTGFLDGGKTSFIRQTMDEDQFKDGLTTLFIVCEEGEEEIDERRLIDSKFILRKIDDEDEVSSEYFNKLDSGIRPQRVIIETNGMWDINEMFDSFPEHWAIAEVITPIDATTFEVYLQNMKMMMTNQYQYSDLVVFNRCTDDYDKAMFKRMVRAVNRRAQVLYETPEGQVSDDVPEELPYDINADEIVINDEDFGIFYVDILDNLDKYKDKLITLKALSYHPKDMTLKDMFVIGRNAMTCCAEDIAFVGFPCRYENAAELKNDEWVMVKAKINIVKNIRKNEPMPLLVVSSIERCEPAKEDVVYFY